MIKPKIMVHKPNNPRSKFIFCGHFFPRTTRVPAPGKYSARHRIFTGLSFRKKGAASQRHTQAGKRIGTHFCSSVNRGDVGFADRVIAHATAKGFNRVAAITFADHFSNWLSPPIVVYCHGLGQREQAERGPWFSAKERKNMETMPPVLTASAVPKGNDKIWSVLCHLSAIIGVGFILPLVVYLVMRQESEYVAANAREALNFHISVLIYAICCIPLVFIIIGVPMLILLGIGSLILAIVGAIKAADGGCYHYPLTLRLV